MDFSRCFDCLDESLRKVASISMIQDAMASGVVPSASHIAFAVKKLWPWRGGPFGCGKV